MLVAGTTSGGAPYGTSLSDFRRTNEQCDRRAGWARAKRALQRAFESSTPSGTDIDVGFVEFLASGLTRSAFSSWIDLWPDPERRSGAYVALIPNGSDPDDRSAVEREATTLRWLADQRFDLRLPRVVDFVDDGGTLILVESFVEGIPLEFRAGRHHQIRPWQVVAETAAKIHAVPPPPSSPPRNCQEHRLQTIAALERDAPKDNLIEDALIWLREHVGEARPGVLLHGDLLGQNLRLHPTDGLGIIDWYYTNIGDPAADLAIVTRGIRRPFQLPDGRQLLLDAYANASMTAEVSAESLHFFELAMVVRWFVEAPSEQHRHDPRRHQIERILHRRK